MGSIILQVLPFYCLLHPSIMGVRVFPVITFVLLAITVQQYILPKLFYLGLTRTVPQFNDQNCKPVHGLEACEDQWIHRASGISYLPCSSLAGRSHWLPAVDLLDNAGVDKLPGDQVFIYNTNNGKIDEVEISNRPSHLTKLHLHAIDAWIDPQDDEKLTFFINNHATPKTGDAKVVGADSTVEIFETRLGSKSWKWVASVKHELVDTPNNLVATGPRSFYVTNDHVAKVSWKRPLNILNLAPGASNIVHCTYRAGTSDCIVAADGLMYPNGIAKGPDATLYMGSSSKGVVTAFHMQADHTLQLGETVANVESIIDNIHVDESGSIIVATIPKLSAFMAREKDTDAKCPAQVFRISNETSDRKFYGSKYTTEILFADGTGELIPGLTNSQLYKKKLYLTGVTTPYMLVCDIGK